MTSWPSGLRRVTRNHFSVGGAGSNPADVVFTFFGVFVKEKSGVDTRLLSLCHCVINSFMHMICMRHEDDEW